MREKMITRALYLDQELNDAGVYILRVMTRRNSVLAECQYLPDGQTVEKASLLFKLLSACGWFKVCDLVQRRKLGNKERQRFHSTYPYVAYFRGSLNFLKEYECVERNASAIREYSEMNRLIREKACLKSNLLEKGWHLYRKDNLDFLYVIYEVGDVLKTACISPHTYCCEDDDYERVIKSEGEASWQIGESVVQQFSKTHPEIMLRQYYDAGGTKVFRYLLSSKRPKDHAFELLAKSGLASLSDNISEFESLNLQASTPSKIFQLPLRFLRLADYNRDWSMLQTKEDRDALGWAIQRCPSLADRAFSEVTAFWIRFSYSERARTIVGTDTYASVFTRTLKFLENQKTLNVFTLLCSYIQYLKASAELGFYLHGITPQDIEEASTQAAEQVYISRKVAKKSYALLNMQNHRWLGESLDTEKYYIQIADSPELHIWAGQELHNCLQTYIVKYSKYTNLAIGLIRDSEENNRLVGAIEINTDSMRIEQAKAKFNSVLPKDVMHFLERYMKRKKLTAKFLMV